MPPADGHNADVRRPPPAVLFDLDCTLTDRRRSVGVFAARFVERFGAELDGASGESVGATIASADGNGYRPRPAFFADLRRGLPWIREPRTCVLEEFWMDVFPACTRPADGLRETLDALRGRGAKLGVVTNGRADVQARKLDVLGIGGDFGAVVISGVVGIRKPDVRIFSMALDALGCPATGSCFVGDHPEYDMLGARAAGLTGIWVSGIHPWPNDREPPLIEIARLPELLQSV